MAERVCSTIIERLLRDGYSFQVSDAALTKVIKQLRGVDPRTVANWKRALVELGYLRMVAIGVYELSPTNVPEIFRKIRVEPQSKVMI